jgi:hypothetical protein
MPSAFSGLLRDLCESLDGLGVMKLLEDALGQSDLLPLLEAQVRRAQR